jgi:hypothetical protein
VLQLDVSDDGFLSLMADDGETKDDVKVPEGEIGEKIDKLFTTEEKDTSEFHHPIFTAHQTSADTLLLLSRCHCSHGYG